MRFKEIQEFRIKQLNLDIGNYRFRKASDQRQCIEKIYSSSPDSFKAMMTSIAEDSIGELLLVYKSLEGDYVVMDGNRRASALKVLDNPDLAPSEATRKRAIELNKKYEIATIGVQAQVSTDKTAILKTIYERHGSTGGKSRLKWPAMAKSRFGFDHDMDITDADWKSIAILYEIEDIDQSLTNRLESKKFSFDVFRRIVPAALSRGIIPATIFSDRDKRIKKSAKALVKKEAYPKCINFIEDIETGAIGLSRGKNNIYASSDGVANYLDKFEQPAPEEPPVVDDPAPINPDDDGPDAPPLSSSNNGVTESLAVKQAIERTNSTKFKQLYNSICTVSLRQHPSLIVIGTWTLLEAISTTLGKDKGVSIDSFFSANYINKFWPNTFKKPQIDNFRHALKYVREEANGIKHSCTYRSDNASNLNSHFECLKPFLLKALKKIIDDAVSVN